MSFFSRLFAKQKEEDYETVLSNLADDIKKRRVKLSEIRLRERRATLLVTLYTLATWVAYVSLWYVEYLPQIRDSAGVRSVGLERAVKAFPVLIGPIVILFIRRIVQIWYKRKGDAEEKTVQLLMKERRTKVEEIKKKTNYYSTRDLLQRYDDSTPTNTPVIPRTLPSQNAPGLPFTPIRQPVPQHPNLGQASGVNPRLAQVMSPPFAATPPRKQWYDKLADKLLGDDEQYNVSPSSRYALICEKCFAHNGLVKESMWEDAQYLCMKCNHFNPSMRSKRQARLSQISPASSPTSSPMNEGITAHSIQLSPSQQPSNDPPTVDAPSSANMDVDS
ncbi:uncharacterized protein LACBIDRAFT_301960 [Laccaria bicolor S238N-H82]|uniref:Endoplasmic reticulum junction formation protein lunapark n=1 Tax=Laccaria bicolor (strain S238N-H82 / ATCC MYA-4686) TaxID=486041 RepID=B0CQ13_LACBS|nr:uncharacterized protein LACBIDRAFT_301960 [Laccaria bicolor S238N-H82]EDR15508.1 predicted protein [Laccaria bicolor S238N-H82]|eukprot:XP_001873716.1 predicted protein [Laccaria bicolor S238N-H82]